MSRKNQRQKGQIRHQDINIYLYVSQRLKACTVNEIAEVMDMTKAQARRALNRLVKLEKIRVKHERFWNGIHYADRFWYW